MSDWRDEMRVNQGGLMRCCLASLSNQLATMEWRPEPGDVLDCEYEEPGNGQLILGEDGITWRWNKREALA